MSVCERVCVRERKRGERERERERERETETERGRQAGRQADLVVKDAVASAAMTVNRPRVSFDPFKLQLHLHCVRGARQSPEFSRICLLVGLVQLVSAAPSCVIE